MENKISIDFTNLSPREKQHLAADLQAYLDRTVKVEASIVKENRNAQDFGTTLSIVLGTAAVTELAKGIAAWLVKHREVSLEVTKGDLTMKVDNITGKDANALMEKFGELVD